MKIQQYSKQNIQKAIKHWQNILKQIDESKNLLLSALIKVFGSNDLVNTARININVLDNCFEIFNTYLFSSSLQKIPLQYESDSFIRKFLVQRKTNKCKIPKMFFWSSFCYM